MKMSSVLRVKNRYMKYLYVQKHDSHQAMEGRTKDMRELGSVFTPYVVESLHSHALPRSIGKAGSGIRKAWHPVHSTLESAARGTWSYMMVRKVATSASTWVCSFVVRLRISRFLMYNITWNSRNRPAANSGTAMVNSHLAEKVTLGMVHSGAVKLH